MRPEKESMLAQLRERVSDSEFVILVDHTGLNVENSANLRDKLRATGSEMHIVRNRLLGRIADDLGWDDMKSSLEGPTATITGDDDVAAVKVLTAFITQQKRPVIKCGVSSDEYLSASAITDMANLPSRDILLAMLARTVAAPITGLMGVMNQKILTLLYALNAIKEKKDQA